MEFTTKFKEKVKSSDEIMDLAKHFKVSYHTMARWCKPEKHDTITKLENVRTLCKYYDTTISEIFNFNYE